MKIRDFIRKSFTIAVLIVYFVFMIFGTFPFNVLFSNEVYAEQVSDKDNLVLVLVDSKVYNYDKDDIAWYADYIQKKNKNTKAIVFPVDTNLVKSTDILKVIENLYFNGEKTKTSFLKAIVLIGNIPLPVVNKDGFIYPSIYPYVDVVKPSFEYDGKYFKFTGRASNVEIAHGIIKFNNLKDYKKYFEKLRTYAQNPQNFVDKAFYYDNFVSLRKSLNQNLIKYYLNKLIFAENLISGKISPLLLQYFDNQNKDSLKEFDENEIVNPNKDDFKPVPNSPIGQLLGFDNNTFKKFENYQKQYQAKTKDFLNKFKNIVNQVEKQKNPYWQIPTLQLDKSLQSFFKNFSQLFGNGYSAAISDNIKATGRYNWNNTVSVLNSIDLKDLVSINYLKEINKKLQDSLYEKIKQEKYFMYYPVMVKYTLGDNNASECVPEQTYETFFFGRNVFDINSLSGMTIFRGTYGNYTGLDALSKLSSRGKRGIYSIMNGLFSTQVEANRAYDSFKKANSDGDNFSKNCSKSYGACTDLGRSYNSESVSHWSKRLFGGYSPLNVNANKFNHSLTYKFPLNYSNFKYAWHPIETPNKNGSLFDLGGSVYSDKKYETDNIFSVIKDYNSVWKTSWYTKSYYWNDGAGYYKCDRLHYADGSSKNSGNYFDYLKNFSSICSVAECNNNGLLGVNHTTKNCTVNLVGNILTVTNYEPYYKTVDDGAGGYYEECSFRKKQVTVFKFIPTLVDHRSPTQDEFSGLNISTWARPVDSTGYVSFLGVGGDTIKLDYPDIFSVYVYKKSGDKLILKSPNEIYQTIISYLKAKVKDYNQKLQNELNKKSYFYHQYKSAWDKISNPKYKPHNYNLLPEDYFVNLIGKDKIAKISELLYYLNLGWKEKTIEPTLSGELSNLYKTFDINQKIEYIVSNYIDTESSYKIGNFDVSHSDINFPGKPKKGYEAGIIFSENLDNSSNIALKNSENQLVANQLLNQNKFLSNLNLLNLTKKECGRPLGQAVILWSWPAAFMCRLQETLKKPFKIGSTASCSNGESFEKSKNNLNNNFEQTLKKDFNLENLRNVSLDYIKSHYPEKYAEWLDLKDFVNQNFFVSTNKSTYDYSDISGYIYIKTSPFLNELNNKVSIISIFSPNYTGNCLWLKTENGNFANSCEGITYLNTQWKIPFYFYNPKTGQGKYFSYKAGTRQINISFCDQDKICYTKKVFFDKATGPLRYIEIKPFSDVMVYGGEDPIIIQGYDVPANAHIYKNQVKDTYYDYKLKLDPPIGVIKTNKFLSGSSQIDFNFSKDLISIKSTTEPLKGVNKFKIVGKLNPQWANLLSGKVLTSFSKTIYIVKKTKLSNSEVTINKSFKNIKLPENSSYFFSGDTFDKNKLWKITIKPIVADRVLKTPVYVTDDSNHFIFGTFVNGKFSKQNDFLITSDSGLTVYAVPTYKTGPFKIKISIPGINPYYINGNILPFKTVALSVNLDKYQAQPNEVVSGTIFGVDKFGNLNLDLSGLKIIHSDGISVIRNGNKLKIKGIKTGWIKFILGDVTNTVYFGVNKTFLPLDKNISVMYLTLLGYNWGKYASKIMSNSSKNLAITTTLVDPKNLHKYDIIVGKNLSLNIPGSLFFTGGNVALNFNKLVLYTNQNPFKNLSIKYVPKLNSILNNGIYYIPQPLDSIVTSNKLFDGSLYLNGDIKINFVSGKISPDISIVYSKSNQNYSVYNVLWKNKLVGQIVFKGNIFDISKFKINKPFLTKKIYADASTNDGYAYGISIGNDSYKYISKNLKLDVENDKGIGFTSNFKNITNFAAGEDVGDAVKPFENEFIVNFGDPFVSRISKEKIIEPVKMSKTYGYNIFSDIAGGIKKVIPLDFNNDGKKDLLILYNDNKIRLLKNYSGKDHFEDLGNIMVFDKPVKNIYAGDYNGDGYEDLYVVFDDGTIRVYKNNHGSFSVNGYPVCLPLPKSDGYHLKYSQIFFRDMNNDGKTDIVVNDLAGNVKIFFGNTYLSKSLTGCDANYKTRIKSQLVKSYGIKVDPNIKFADDGYIWREGLEKKADPELLKSKLQKAFESGNFSNIPKNANITPSNYISQVQKKGQDKVAYQSIPKALGPSYENFSGDTVLFKKITFLTGSDPVKVYKTMEDLNGGDLIPGDKVKITLHFEDPSNKKFTYLEVLKGPFGVISIDNKPILELNGISTGQISFPSEYPMFLFKVDGVNHTSSLSYYAIYQGGSSVKIKVGDFDKNNYGDIKVFLQNGCIKGYDYFQGENGGIPMDFSYSFKNLATALKQKLSSLKPNQSVSQLVNEVKSGDKSKLQELLDKYGGGDNKSNPWYLSETDLNLTIGPDVNKIKAKVNKVLQGLCHGFSIGKSDCGGIDVPCNFAFFAPGEINACGCPLGIDPGTPVFWFPGTFSIPLPHGGCAGPIPMPYFRTIQDPPLPEHAPIVCMGPKFPSYIRIYLAPTLTKSLGIAVCFGPYKLGMHLPPAPAGAIAGNCIVAAKSLSYGKCNKNKNQNADNEETEDLLDLTENGVCNQLPFSHGIYPISPLEVPSANAFFAASINPAFESASAGGIINFNMTAHKINSPEDAQVLLKGGVPFHLKIETGTFRGIIKCIIKKWLNKQIQFLINQLTQMNIYIVYPNVDDLISNINHTRETIGTDFSNMVKNMLSGFNGSKLIEKSGIKNPFTQRGVENKIKALFPSKDLLKEVNQQLSNPFRQLQIFLKQIPLVNVSMKNITIKVPWIGKDEIERQITYLKAWLERNKGKVKEWTDYYYSAVGKCKENYPNDPAGQKQCEQKYANILKVQKFVQSVQKNIEILNEYRNLPLQLYQYTHLFDTYLSQLFCILTQYLDSINGWLARNSYIFQKWVDAIITLINVIKTWQILIDISVNWKTTCGKCRADNGDLYDCTLSGLCPDLPVFPIPPFKIPDIFIDLSHINLGIDVVLPKITIYPVPVGLFTLPDLPTPSISVEVPPVPLLPQPPTLPKLPALPAVPTFELPNLPPPPLIPKILPSIKSALNIFKIVGYFRCIIKNGIGLVAEWNVKTRIEQLTARTNRLFPFDFLTIDFPVLPWKGFNVKVDAYLNYKLNFDQVYQFVKNLADSINGKTSRAINDMLEFNAKWNEKVDELNQYNDLNIEIKKQSYAPLKKYLFASKENSIQPKIAKAYLYDQLKYLISEKDKDYLKSLPTTIYERAQQIMSDLLKPTKVYPNYKGINQIRDKLKELIQRTKEENDNIVKRFIRKWEEGKLTDVSSNKLVSDNIDSNKHYVFKSSLFVANNFVLNILKSAKDPRISYLEMYGKVLNKFAQKLPKYESKKDNKYFIYKEMELPIKQSLKVINAAIGTNYKFAISNSSSSTTVMVDPAQLIRGLYIKGDDGTYYNVMADKNKAKKIRESNSYVLSDLNNDGYDDLIWYDNYNVYVKYSNDEPENNGVIYNELYIYPSTVKNFANIVDKNGFVKIGDSKFKIWSSKLPVNDLTSEGSSYENLSLSFSNDKTVNAYVLLYSSRPDILDDIEKRYNYSDDFDYDGVNYKTYGIVLYDSKLGKVNEIMAQNILVNGHKAKYFVYVPVDGLQNQDKILAVLKKELLRIHGWKYFRVIKANLNLEIKQLTMLSSYSNQDVGGEQLIGDDISPELTVNLLRNEVKIVGTGNDLYGYVNTHYLLRGVWKDNVSMKAHYITDENYHVLTTGNYVKIYENEPTVKTYHFIGVDWNGNRTDQVVKVHILVPKIQIVGVNPEKGEIIAKISNDMDLSAVKFYVNENGQLKELKSINGKSVFTGDTGKVIFTGAVFNNTKHINLYDFLAGKQKLIGWIDMDKGILYIKPQDPPYYVIATPENGILYEKVYDPEGKVKFKIYIPSEKLIDKPEMLNTSKYELKSFTGATSLGEFEDSYCILDKLGKQCAVYIQKDTGKMYFDPNYAWSATYSPNELGYVTYKFYDVPPLKELINSNNAVFTLTVKPESLLNK